MSLFYPRLTGQVGGNTDGTTANVSTGTMILAGGANITLSQDANTITIVGAAGGGAGGSQSIGMSNLGNTSGTTGIASGSAIKYYFAGGNNITLSQSINGASGTVTISAFNQAAAGSQTAGMSNLGNTSGTTGIASGSAVALFLAGGNNVTLSQSVNGASATVTISAFTQTLASQSAGMSNLGNTSGTTGIASGGAVRILFAGGDNITLSQSVNGASATITISGAAGGGAAAFTASSFEVGAALGIGSAATGSLAQNTLYFVPDNLPNISAIAIKLPVSIRYGSTASALAQVGHTLQFGIYTRATANSDSLSRHYSTSYTMSGSFNSNVSAVYAVNTGFANSTSYNVLTVSSLGDALSVDVDGLRELILPISSNFSAGEYWFAYLNSSSSAIGGGFGSVFRVSHSLNTMSVFRPFQHSVNTALGLLRNIGLGPYTASTAVLPAGMAFSDISAGGGGSLSIVRGFLISATQ